MLRTAILAHSEHSKKAQDNLNYSGSPGKKRRVNEEPQCNTTILLLNGKANFFQKLMFTVTVLEIRRFSGLLVGCLECPAFLACSPLLCITKGETCPSLSSGCKVKYACMAYQRQQAKTTDLFECGWPLLQRGWGLSSHA